MLLYIYSGAALGQIYTMSEKRPTL